MTFKVGDIVTLVQFKRDGTVLEVLKDGLYKVTLGNLPVTVSADQLVKSTHKRSKNSTRVKEYSVERSIEAPTNEREELDLHGKTVLEAIDLVEGKLNRAVLSNMHRVKLVHGLGSGRLKDAIHEYLAQCSLVSAFKLDEWNTGVTWVYL